MAKNLKITIKNAQIAEAINLSGLKNKLEAKKAASKDEAEAPKTAQEADVRAPTKKAAPKKSKAPVPAPEVISTEVKEPAPKIKARSKSAFSEPHHPEVKEKAVEEESQEEYIAPKAQTKEHALSPSSETESEDTPPQKSSEQLRREIFAEEIEELKNASAHAKAAKKVIPEPLQEPVQQTIQPVEAAPQPIPKKPFIPKQAPMPSVYGTTPFRSGELKPTAPSEKLGPTGRHVKDLLPQKPVVPPHAAGTDDKKDKQQPAGGSDSDSASKAKDKVKGKPRAPGFSSGTDVTVESAEVRDQKAQKFKEFKDIKTFKKVEPSRFDARDRQGLGDESDKQHWRRRRVKAPRVVQEDITIRPTSLKIRTPIALKDLAAEMKLKASQLIAKLFLQGTVLTLNDLLEDETTIQLLGHEFGCEIEIDTSVQQRIQITDKTVKEEIGATPPEQLIIRPPVVAFMGHVDHGKTSLIDAIRKSNRVAGEAGAITQHIGAFRCSSAVGDIAILDTPGHEAFSAMRSRGADVTDIVVLVIAGDEGMKQQTIEAMQHAKAAGVTIVVALNKCDKPNFNAENVYRQLAEQELLPEAWGGQTITINCSATTGEGIPQLLEMLALQAEVLELKANPSTRARGAVLESEMHKGMGPVATVLVQNGTLRTGDAVVIGSMWGRVKTMHDEFRREFVEAGPSTPVEITGLSGLPEAGQDFIVVKNEKEAREIAEARQLETKHTSLRQTKIVTMDSLILQATESTKKVLNVLLRADVQGSLEALKAAIMKIESTKAQINIIFAGVGEVSESDVQRAVSAKATIVGFHSQIESHAEALLKPLGVQVRLHKIIYHAVDDVRDILKGLLDKIAIETDKGKAEVKAIFKSSHSGVIAGCQVIDGIIQRNYQVRLRRDKEVIWKGAISSLKRVKEDVREVAKGMECGIILANYTDVMEGDILEAYEVTYISQEL